jgi:hypothetical protein
MNQVNWPRIFLLIALGALAFWFGMRYVYRISANENALNRVYR